MSVREKNYEDVERSVLETVAWSKINGINPRFRVNIYISFFDRVYELNLLIYDNDDDDGTMISLNMRILVFFSRYDNKYLSSRFQKDFYTRWCLNFCFFFFSIFFTKSNVAVLKSFMKLALERV